MNQDNVSTTISDVSSFAQVRKGFYLIIKRLTDILFSLVGIIFLIPIALFVKIFYMLTGDFHPIIYSHDRVGKNGKVFKMFKFRSMVYNADEELKKILKIKKYRDEWNEFQKITDDPRITKIGKILRKTSLDETPQFINVLLGDLSLIGPRPLVPGELSSHRGNHKIYESVKPGITGWWAVNGRSATSYKKRLELEYYYVQNMGFKIDFLCIIKTLKVIFNRNGAK